VGDGLGGGVDAVAEAGKAVLLQPVDDDAAAYPEHGGGADDGQELEQDRHAQHEAAAEGAATGRLAAGQRHAEVVGLHDQGHDPVDGGGDADPHDGRTTAWVTSEVAGDARQGDRHDLGGEDEVGLDRAGDLLVLDLLGSRLAVAPAWPWPSAAWGHRASWTFSAPSKQR
jgi:hypothetical protein